MPKTRRRQICKLEIHFYQILRICSRRSNLRKPSKVYLKKMKF